MKAIFVAAALAAVLASGTARANCQNTEVPKVKAALKHGFPEGQGDMKKAQRAYLDAIKARGEIDCHNAVSRAWKAIKGPAPKCMPNGTPAGADMLTAKYCPQPKFTDPVDAGAGNPFGGHGIMDWGSERAVPSGR